MNKRGLHLRLKYALWDLYTDTLWDKWKIPRVKDKTFKQTYIEECDRLILAMDSKSRNYLLQWLELKSMARIRENTKFLDNEKTLINRSRLFEDISLKQDIERVIEKENMERAEMKKKVLKDVQ